MKVVILAGGLGTRLSEETAIKPKPMVEIGGMPIIWHIMKSYSWHGINEFIICCGYKGYMIKEYFANYFLHMSDMTVDLKTNHVIFHNRKAEPWKVTLVDTGDDTMTGGRMKRVRNYLGNDEAFCMTYGDGVSDVNISTLVDFHIQHGRYATITAVKPPGRFGAIECIEDEVVGFTEKPRGDGGLINGGFFVLSPKCFDFIDGDETVWEEEPLRQLVESRQSMAFEHVGFWQAMDTLRDKNHLESLWRSGNAEWKTW